MMFENLLYTAPINDDDDYYYYYYDYYYFFNQILVLQKRYS